MIDRTLQKLIKNDTSLNGYLLQGEGRRKTKVKGWLELLNFTEDDIEEMYNRMKKEIKRLKDEFGDEIVRYDRIYYKWELELFKSFGAIRVIEDKKTVVILQDKCLKGRNEYVPFTFYLLSLMLKVYKNKLAYAKDQEEQATLGLEEYEKRREEKWQKIKEGMKKILNTDENNFEEELETEKKRLEEQEKKEVHNEFIKPRELKEGEIDVNKLPL